MMMERMTAIMIMARKTTGMNEDDTDNDNNVYDDDYDGCILYQKVT